MGLLPRGGGVLPASPTPAGGRPTQPPHARCVSLAGWARHRLDRAWCAVLAVAPRLPGALPVLLLAAGLADQLHDTRRTRTASARRVRSRARPTADAAPMLRLSRASARSSSLRRRSTMAISVPGDGRSS